MRKLWLRRFGRQTVTFWFCVAVLGGLVAGRTDYGYIGWELVWPVLGLLIVNWRHHNIVTILLITLIGLQLGVSRGHTYEHNLSSYQNLAQQPVSVRVIASSDGIYGKSKQLTFLAGHVVLKGGQRLTGTIQVSGFGVNSVFEGDELSVSGKLYPGRGAVQAYLSFAKLNLIRRHTGFTELARQKFTAGMQTALPEPLSPFAMGLLVGQRANLPDGIKQDLLMVGLTHIIAVSGYNLTIILHASRTLLARHSKRLSTLLAFGLIALFLLIAGTSASIVRAAIVSTLSIITSYYGRKIVPLNLLAIAAAITAWAKPSYLWGDLSWYLSFLAFFGVMVLAPLIKTRLGKYWRDNVLSQVALETICAEIMSLPIILHVFGQMSLVGLPANILITSLVPLAMLLSLIAGLAGMLWSGLAGWLAWPAQLLLNYMLDLAHIMAHWPGIFKQNLSLGLVQMLGLYSLIILIVCLLHYKTKSPKHATVTDTNVRTQQMVNY